MIECVTFCQGCNEKFSTSRAGGACPYCGVELVALDLASTAGVDDLVAREVYADSRRKLAAEEDPLVGKELGAYRVEELIGRGGMARVYRVLHTSLQRPCALKVLSPRLTAQNRGYVDLFFHEARTAAALNHPNVVTVHNLGVADSYHFIEMEFVDGRSLQRVVEEEGRMNPVQATSKMINISLGLAHAHRLGMVHRDLKPANVLVDSSGKAKIADFGLAKRVVSDELPLGASGVVGTPYFMAPELFRGTPGTERSDVYAAGVTLYYLLTGALPFSGHSVTLLAEQHTEAPIPDVRRLAPLVPFEVATVLERCLAKDPAERYENAGAMHRELKSVFGNLRDMDSLVREGLRDLDVQWKVVGDSVVVEVQLASGRSQRVLIESTADKSISRRVVKIYSVAAPLEEKYVHRALELNASIPYNSIGVLEVDGRPHFIMIQTYPRATCDPADIRHSVVSVAHWADVVEAYFTGRDRY